jgi:H+/Cl- antiporter ClcA
MTALAIAHQIPKNRAAMSVQSRESPDEAASRSPIVVLAAVTVLTGIGAGLGGMLLALLLHWIQHLAYGYSTAHVISAESFLQGVSDSAPSRRLAVLLICGMVAGLGWWALYRFGRPLVGIRRALGSDDPRMPVVSTTIHTLLQIVTVALGSPLGREVAPREVGAMLAGWLSHRAGLTPAESRLMVACGAGAGLAAVYNVPLGGALFVLEVLLGTFEWSVVVPALLTSTIAAVVAWIGLGNAHQYTVPDMTLNASLVVWSVVCGPLFGLAAYAFVRLMGAARKNAPKDWRLALLSLINFAAIGLLVMHFPQLPGNGKGPATLSFDTDLTAGFVAILLLLRVLITYTTLRAGAAGGLLTPGLANGAMLGVIFGTAWTHFWPGMPLGGFAIVGAAAFLASSMQMPLTAIVLIVEFTLVGHDFLVPITLAVAGSVATSKLLARLPALAPKALVAGTPRRS